MEEGFDALKINVLFARRSYWQSSMMSTVIRRALGSLKHFVAVLAFAKEGASSEIRSPCLIVKAVQAYSLDTQGKMQAT